MIFSLLSIVLTSNCQDTISLKCNSEYHNQFNFWLGDWVIHDSVGDLLGANTIVRMQDNCLLQENWTSVKSNYTGTSYNYFDSGDSSWNQLWIDNQGGSLKLKGKMMNASMVLKSELIPGKKVAYYFNQITWTPEENGTVMQLWEIFIQDGHLLSTAFKGIYSRKDEYLIIFIGR